MTFTFLACSITGAKPTLQTLTSSASQLRANTIGQDYFSCCGGGETEARSKERADLSPLRGAPFALTSRRHPAPILTSIDFRRSHLWSKACGSWDAVGWILMPGPSSEVPLRVWEAAAVPPAGEWDTHFRGCGVLAHPGLFQCNKHCVPALLQQAESPHHGPVSNAQGQWVCGCPAPCMKHALMCIHRGCPGRASWCIYLCTHTGVHKHGLMSALGVSPAPVLC